MMFSIIVPIYNTEKYLDKCIQSVINQTYDDYELIMIDDCSTDSSFEIACKYSQNNIKIIKNKNNSGLSITRNAGIREASGEYIFFLDSDDYIDKNALSDLSDLIYRNEFPDIIYTKFIEEREKNRVIKCGYASEPNKLYSREEFLKGELEKRTLYAAACFGIYKRKFIVHDKLYFSV